MACSFGYSPPHPVLATAIIAHGDAATLYLRIRSRVIPDERLDKNPLGVFVVPTDFASTIK
jgi:hypothetical protein